MYDATEFMSVSLSLHSSQRQSLMSSCVFTGLFGAAFALLPSAKHTGNASIAFAAGPRSVD